jgi:hypothetical protein
LLTLFASAITPLPPAACGYVAIQRHWLRDYRSAALLIRAAIIVTPDGAAAASSAIAVCLLTPRRRYFRH